jgi:K+-transporting ATPase KdpF subunit
VSLQDIGMSLLAVGLALYLLVALLDPERFS